MRKTLTLLLLLTYCLAVISQPAWKEYVYDAHQFKIDFYQMPEFSTERSVLNDSTLITYYWELNVDDPLHENIYYSASQAAYPSEFIHSDSLFPVVDGFINSTQNSLLEDDTFTLLSSSLVEKHGFPGKVYKWKNNSNNVFLEFHVYMVENKLFQLSVVSREGKNHNPLISKYFDSFELIDIPRGNYNLPDQANIQILEPTIKEDNMVYIAMETKYPSGIVDTGDPVALNSLYKKAIDGSLNSVNGDLISINDVYYKDHPGKEYRCYFSEGNALMVYRYYFIDDNFYSLGVITLPEKDNNKGMTGFFDSFGIID
jgi:hypothetical protein